MEALNAKSFQSCGGHQSTSERIAIVSQDLSRLPRNASSLGNWYEFGLWRSAVWITRSKPASNVRFHDNGGNAARTPPHVQSDAASSKYEKRTATKSALPSFDMFNLRQQQTPRGFCRAAFQSFTSVGANQLRPAVSSWSPDAGSSSDCATASARSSSSDAAAPMSSKSSEISNSAAASSSAASS